jgi:hypothetical protein
MRASVAAHPIAGKMLRGGVAEVTLRWDDDDTGIKCKARADYYVEARAACFDLKTTEDARPDSFARSVAKYRYHVQHAFYASGFAAIGKPLRHFVFVAIEKKPPYAIGLYVLDADAIERGDRDARANLTTLADCIERGEFPAYSPSIETLSLPRWA